MRPACPRRRGTGGAGYRRRPCWRGFLAAAFAALLVTGALPSSAAPKKTRIRYVTSEATRFLYVEDIAAYYGMAFGYGKQQVTLKSAYSSLTFTIGRCEGMVNGVQVHLSDAIWAHKGNPVMADNDFRLLLEPVLRPKVLKRQPVRRILIDPGHGGKDPGAVGKTYHEKALTLAVAKQLAAALQGAGYTVALTRDKDVDVAIDQRVRQAETWKADLLLSIHCNAAGTASVRGIEVFRTTPHGSRSTYGSRRTTTAAPNNTWDLNNARLAYELQKGLVAASGAEDRGVKKARFMVIRDCTVPAVLLELGYVSNPGEERLLGSPAYQARLVSGMVTGIGRYARALESP